MGKSYTISADIAGNIKSIHMVTITSDHTTWNPRGQWNETYPNPYYPFPNPYSPFVPQPYVEQVYIPYPATDTTALKQAIEELKQEVFALKEQGQGATEKEKVALDLLLNHDANDTKGLQRILKAVKLLLDK
jgi:hypothetical protein